MKYKNHRYNLPTLLKEIKQNYYEHFFESNWSNVKNNLKGIKSLITLQNTTPLVPRAISQGEITIDNPYDIANFLSNYFFLLLKVRSKAFPNHTKIYQIISS